MSSSSAGRRMWPRPGRADPLWRSRVLLLPTRRGAACRRGGTRRAPPACCSSPRWKKKHTRSPKRIRSSGAGPHTSSGAGRGHSDRTTSAPGRSHRPVDGERHRPVGETHLAGGRVFFGDPHALTVKERQASRLLPLTVPLRYLSLIHISEPTRRTPISYAVF